MPRCQCPLAFVLFPEDVTFSSQLQSLMNRCVVNEPDILTVMYIKVLSKFVKEPSKNLLFSVSLIAQKINAKVN